MKCHHVTTEFYSLLPWLFLIALPALVLFAADAQGGVILLGDDSFQGASDGCGAGQATCLLPVETSPDEGVARQAALLALLNAGRGQSGGASGVPLSSAGAGSCTAFSAVLPAAFDFSPPALVVAVLGEGPLAFKSPPVFELLRPPKV